MIIFNRALMHSVKYRDSLTLSCAELIEMQSGMLSWVGRCCHRNGHFWDVWLIENHRKA